MVKTSTPRSSNLPVRAPQSRFDKVLSTFLPTKLHRLVRFSMAGAATTLFYFAIVNALVLAVGTAPVAASVIGYLTAIAMAYGLQSRFTFRTDSDSGDQITRFLITSFAGLAFSYGVMVVVSGLLHWHYLIGTLAVCMLIPVGNYLVFSIWVFRHRPAVGSGSSTSTEKASDHER